MHLEAPMGTLGPFTLLARLGSGGMAETFLARRSDGDGDEVCLKVVRQDLKGDRRVLALFREEGRVHRALCHPNIVRMIDSGSDQGRDYLVLELVRGVALSSLVEQARARRGRKLLIPVAVYVIRAISEALDYAHNLRLEGVHQNIVHRDVSPSNVLVGHDGSVKLSDFGIAKAQTRNYATTAGVVRGKLAYMSPEQIQGDTVDHRSDLFSLGIIAYQLLTNLHPFAPGPSVPEVAIPHRILTGQREHVSVAAPSLPVYLVDLVEQLLTQEPAGRIPSAALVVRALRDDHGQSDAVRALSHWTRDCDTAHRPDADRAAAGAPSIPESGAYPEMVPTQDVSIYGPGESLDGPEEGRTRVASVLPGQHPLDPVAAYMAKLPRGLVSYPGHTAKASLVNAYLASRPLDASSVPAELQGMIERPPRANVWVPEAHFLVLALLIRAKHFKTDELFLAWVKDINAQLFRGPIYRPLMFVATTRVLVAGTALRWRQFHQASTLTAQHGEGRWVDVRFGYPPHLFETLHVRLFLASIEAALEAAASRTCRAAFLEVTRTEARARIEW